MAINHDTRTRFPHFEYRFRQDGTVTPSRNFPKRSNGGRPSKGQRHTFAVKPDLDRAAKLVEALDILGTDGVSLLTPVVNRFIDSLDLEKLKNQEALPIAKAS